MKNKKLIARIGAILACVLLVGSLAIPAFADDVTPQPQTLATVPIGTAQQIFEDMLATANNYAFQNLYSYYLGYGDTRFFTMDYLVSGTVSNGSAALPFTLTVGEDTTSIFVQIPIDAVSYEFYLNSDATPTYNNVVSGGSINVTINANTTDGYMVTVAYVPQGQLSATFSFIYKGTTQDYLTPYIIQAEGNNITATMSMANIAFTIARASSEWSPMLTTVCALLFDDSTPNQLDNVLFSPKQFYYGLNESYNLGYDDGYRVGFGAGYDEGYDDGYDQGYDEGLGDNTAYQSGYDAAVRDIDSGEFGRNFIGNVLKAPFDALNTFTLVQWTTAEGTTITISLAAIISAAIGVSLFIWFLKVFAGG